MTKGKRPFFRKSDFLVLLFLSLAVFSAYYLRYMHSQAVESYAEVLYGRHVLAKIPLVLGEEKSIQLPDLPQITFHTYKDGSIAFEHSSCADQICVRTGKIKYPGEFAACLPNQTLLRIVSATEVEEQEKKQVATQEEKQKTQVDIGG